MLANGLSLLRLLFLPFVLHALKQSQTLAAVALLLAAAATDLADGYVARRLGQVSRLGKILDPLADKVFLVGLATALVLWHGFPLWLLLALGVRDLGILLAGLLLLRARNLVVPANRLGKYTTACMSLTCLSYLLPAPGLLRQVLTGAAALLVLASSLSYSLLLRRILQGAG
jgi:cardiolipin synthase